MHIFSLSNLRPSSQQMEENPIYGNISYTQTSKCFGWLLLSASSSVWMICIFFYCRHWIWCPTFKDSTEIQYGLTGSLYRDIIWYDPQSMIWAGSWLTKCSKSCAVENTFSCLYSQQKPQECYANLTLKAPRVQSGRSSPQIEYSDIIQVEDPPESEREDEGCAEGASIVSDLYASVQTQRVITIDPVGEGEGYANHLWEEVTVEKPHMQICACWNSSTGWRCGTMLQYPNKGQQWSNQASADWGLSGWIVAVWRFFLFCCLCSGKG